MEALLIEYAKRYGIEQALEMLGLKKKSNLIFGMPFTNKKVSFNPMNMIANQGLKALTSGSSMGMALPFMAGGLGLGYLRNPLREGSMNFNPYLKDQMTYLSKNNMLGTDRSGLTKYGPDSVLAGQNVVSMFGTNDYIDQLNKYKDKYGKTMSKERLDKLNKEIADYELDQVRKELKKDLQNINAGDNDGGSDGSNKSSGSKNSQGMTSSQHAAFRMARGGIASI